MDEASAPAPQGRGPVWRRGGVALVLLIAAEIGLCLLWATAVLQVGWTLVTGARNDHLAAFGASLATWMAHVARFVTCVSEERPFPWASWPKAGRDGP